MCASEKTTKAKNMETLITSRQNWSKWKEETRKYRRKSSEIWRAWIYTTSFYFRNCSEDQIEVENSIHFWGFERDLTCPEPEGWWRTGWERSQGWTLASNLWEETFPHLKKMKMRTFSGERPTIFPLTITCVTETRSETSLTLSLMFLQRSSRRPMLLVWFFIPSLFVPLKSLITKRQLDVIKSYPK